MTSTFEKLTFLAKAENYGDLYCPAAVVDEPPRPGMAIAPVYGCAFALRVRKSGRLSLGSVMAWQNGWSAAANVDGKFSRKSAAYSDKGTVRYAW